MPHINASSYGEARLRMLRIVPRGDRDDPRDLTVAIRFEGDYSGAFRGPSDGPGEGEAARGRGDGAHSILPGETLKNLVHRVAREHAHTEIELFGLTLCERLLEQRTPVGRVRVDIVEQPWSRLEVGGKAQGQAFAMNSGECRTASVTSNGERAAVIAGLDNLTLMRTSGFAPPRHAADLDQGASDGLQRLLVAGLSARWRYVHGEAAFGPCRRGVRAALVETFARDARHSVAHTLYAMADVILAAFEDIEEITLALQERPYRPADLFHDAVAKPDELFVARDEPIGLVEVTVGRNTTA